MPTPPFRPPQTDRLKLVRVVPEHADDVLRCFDSEVTALMEPAPLRDRAEALAVIARFEEGRRRGRDLVFAVTLRESGEFLGIAGLHGLDSPLPELGLWIKTAAHGRHFGREAASCLIGLARELGLTALRYPVDRRNAASRKIPLAFGGRKTGEAPLVTPDGRRLELEFFEIPLSPAPRAT